MKRILDSNSSHSEIPILSRAEDAGLPPQPQGNTPTVPDEPSTIPHLSNRPPTPDPIDAWVDSLLTHALPDTLGDVGITSAPRLVNAQQRHADESESRLMPQQPQPIAHAASANSSIASETASDVLASLKEAAHQGDADAQFHLGGMYETGEGIEQDVSQALAWYRLAANQGHAAAQFHLGVMYETGKDVKKDKSQAVAWYRLAANQGHADAQYYLGDKYEHGIGVEQDKSQALVWYFLAANQGHAEAQNQVVSFYFYGLGVIKDVELATYWLLKYGLTVDDKRIILEGTFKKYPLGMLLKFVLDVLNKFTEFQAVTELVLESNWFSEDNFAQIGKLIKANTTLESLRMTGVSNRKAMMSLLVKSLEFNTQLTHLSFDNGDSDDEDSDSSDRVDEDVETQKTQLLNRNMITQYLNEHR